MNPPLSSRGHTQRYLQKLFDDHRLAPRSSLGQCFLIDLNLLDILVDAAELNRTDFVLEVGTGTGSLTERLAARAGAVLSVEIDRGLYELANNGIERFPNARVINADILERKNALNPEVLSAVDQSLQHGSGLRLKVVANLPYVVATPVISLIMLDDRAWSELVVTIQKELAERLIATPGTKDYGSLSILTQSLGDAELLRELPPTAFWPRPRVSSAFVRIRLDPAKRSAIRNVTQFARLTRGVMLHRRKVLRSALKPICRARSKSEIDGFLQAMGLGLQTRAEALPPSEFVRLANALPEGWLED